MGRGKIEIKKIENVTNRQVTYSKRRMGLMKKARELTVLCDVHVSILMISSSGKFTEFCSPSTDLKKIIDRYQQVTGINLWSVQYERMQNTLDHLKQINTNLRREVRQRMGEDNLDGFGMKELRGLEQSLDDALTLVRKRKYHVLTTQTETYRKKLKNYHETNKSLLRELHELVSGDELADYMFMADEHPAGCKVACTLANNGVSQVLQHVQLQPNQPDLPGTASGYTLV